MDREKIRSFIPDKTPLAAIKCPVCSQAPWSWYNLLEDGEILECADCKTQWHWDPADTSETWNIPAVFRYHRLQRILEGLTAAGLAWQVEGDRRQAEKAAVVIERFAEVFKGYRMNMIHRNQWLDRADPYYAKIAGWKFREMAMVGDVLMTYDMIHDSGVLTPAQIAKIDRDLVAYTRDYLLEGYGAGGPASPDSLQDQGPSWWVLAACGALLGDVKTLDVMVDACEKILDPANGMFYEDGSFFQGSPSYQNQLLHFIAAIPDIIAGNTGRDVYSNPRCALLEKCYTWTLDFVFPDGTVPSINDAHVGEFPSRRLAEIAARRYGSRKAVRYLAESREMNPVDGNGLDRLFRSAESPPEDGEAFGHDSVHLGGAGLMVLRHGDDRTHWTMAFIDYGAYEPANKPPYHKHRDYLNFGLWAAGMEMVSEIGYAMTPPWVQKWQVSPLAHNTVLEAGEQKEGGQALLWHITPGPKMAEAGLPPANSRFIALLPRTGGEPVVVDIFRVSGEVKEFTWAMHARSGDLEVGGINDWIDVEIEQPLRRGRQANPPEGVIEALWRFPGAGGRGLKVLIPALKGCSVVASECPPEENEIKSGFLSGGTPKPGIALPYRGHLQVKRPGPEALFVAVHLPYSGDAVPRLTGACEELGGGTVALRLDFPEETFLLIHSPRQATRDYAGLSLDGRAGAASFRNGNLVTLSLAEGRSLAFGSTGIFRSTVGNGFREVK